MLTSTFFKKKGQENFVVKLICRQCQNLQTTIYMDILYYLLNTPP